MDSLVSHIWISRIFWKRTKLRKKKFIRIHTARKMQPLPLMMIKYIERTYPEWKKSGVQINRGKFVQIQYYRRRCGWSGGELRFRLHSEIDENVDGSCTSEIVLHLSLWYVFSPSALVHATIICTVFSIENVPKFF